MGDSKPPQAIVKPQILTHIIEGFVIQEGAEPFPVGIFLLWGKVVYHFLGRVVGFHLCIGVSFPIFQFSIFSLRHRQ